MFIKKHLLPSTSSPNSIMSAALLCSPCLLPFGPPSFFKETCVSHGPSPSQIRCPSFLRQGAPTSLRLPPAALKPRPAAPRAPPSRAAAPPLFSPPSSPLHKISIRSTRSAPSLSSHSKIQLFDPLPIRSTSSEDARPCPYACSDGHRPSRHVLAPSISFIFSLYYWRSATPNCGPANQQLPFLLSDCPAITGAGTLPDAASARPPSCAAGCWSDARGEGERQRGY